MLKKIVFILLVIISFVQCVNKEEEIYFKLSELCDSLKLSNCQLEVDYSSDTDFGQKRKLSVRFEGTPNTHLFYKQNKNSLFGKIAYEICFNMNKDTKEKYSEIELHGIVDSESILKNYKISELVEVGEFLKMTHEFIRMNNDTDVIDNKYISDSTLVSIRNGINYMSKCGDIVNIELLGVYFDTVKSTNEKVVVIEEYLMRENSEERFTFYIHKESKKIIYIDMGSSMACE